jgi:hypothetical protein
VNHLPLFVVRSVPLFVVTSAELAVGLTPKVGPADRTLSARA